MIEVTIGKVEYKKIEKEEGFPKLMRSEETGSLVLFIAKSQGIMVDRGENVFYKSGAYSSTWDMDVFEDYNEPITITIQNKVD